MTRKHYEAVARIIAAIEDPEQRRKSCDDAIRELRGFNPRFSAYTFRTACGVES